MNAEKFDRACELIAEGQSLRAACEAVELAKTSFLRWCDEDKARADQYTRAREQGADAEFEDLQNELDEAPQMAPSGAVDAGWVAWKRLRVDTKKWALSKKAPKRYGDSTRHELTGADGRTLAQELAGLNAIK